MEAYNFWADLLASYRASPDFIKALWLLAPLIVAAGLFVLMAAAAMRLTERRGEPGEPAHRPEEESEAGRHWLTAATPVPLIGHERADEAADRRRRP